MITREIRRGELFADRYRVIRRLGAGGMATVWLAEDERLGRDVAIKRLRTDAPEESLTRFRREARLGATQITAEGKVIGTMPYMAPERMQAAGAGGPASDVYALAAVAYELLSGSALDAGATGHEHPPDRQDLAAGWPDAPTSVFAVVM